MSDRGAAEDGEESSVFPHTIIAVVDRPVCVWDLDLVEHNRDFCQNLDPNWFMRAVEQILQADEASEVADVAQGTAIAVRLTYHHAMETFFALFFAGLQAPECLPAWLDLYQPGELKQLVERISVGGTVLNGWGIPQPTWENVSRVFNVGDWPDRTEETRAAFAACWAYFAADYLNEDTRAEYNSIKHGFRARPSGGALRIGREHRFGMAPPEEEMQLVGSSRHGSFSFVLEAIPQTRSRRKAHHVHMKTKSVLWAVEPTVQKLDLLRMSMSNVLSTVRLRAGAEPATAPFVRPEDFDTFEKPWRTSTGVLSFSMSSGGPSEAVADIPPEELLAVLRRASGLAPENDAGAE